MKTYIISLLIIFVFTIQLDSQQKKKDEEVKVKKVVNKLKTNIKKKYTPGLAKTEKAQSSSKKENDDYISSVTKKMKEYLKDGSKEEYNPNPQHFPMGNGELAKMEKMAYVPSEAVEEYEDAFSYPGQTNLVYDEIKPEDKAIEKQLKGDSTNGNAVTDKDGKALGNVSKRSTKVGDRFKKNFDDNLYGAEQMDASYKRQPAPVDVSGEETTEGDLKSLKSAKKAQKIFDKLEESIKDKKVINDMEKMKNLIGYNRKTQ